MVEHRLRPPRLGRVLRRPRLERALHDGALTGAVHVEGIAGSGRTTLVASWLRAERRPAVWYRLHSFDDDPARFFEALRVAFPSAPRYTPGSNVAELAPTFFAELFAHFRRRTALVFEDLHEVAPEGPVAQAVGIALAHASGEHPVVITSRSAPAPAFELASSRGRACALAPRELLLTRSEVAELMQLRPEWRASVHSADEIFARTRGWFAAVVVMLVGRVRLEGLPEDRALSEVFAALAGEVLGSLDRATLGVLESVAFLPDFSLDEAVAQSGVSHAAACLNALRRRGLLLDEVEAGRLQMQPLLVASLRDRVEPDRGRALRERAVKLLCETGRLEDAVELSLEGSTQAAREELILASAEVLWAGGRWLTLKKLLEATAALPGADPWIDFWRARLLLTTHVARAGRAFEDVGQRFARAHDGRGVARAFIGRIQAILYEGASFAPLISVLGELGRIEESYPALPTDVQAELVAFVLMAIWSSGGARDRLEHWVARARALLTSDASPVARVTVGSALISHLTFAGAVVEAEAVRSQTATLADREPGLAASAAFDLASARLSVLSGDSPGAILAIERGLARLERSGLGFWRDSLVSTGLPVALTLGDLPRAERHLTVMNQIAARGRTIDVGNAFYGAALIALNRNDFGAAQALAARAREHAEALGFPAVQAFARALHAMTLEAMGQRHEAEQLMASARSVAGVPRAWPGLFALMEASWDTEPPEHLLREGFATLRESGTAGVYALIRSDALARLCASALAHAVEPEHVRRIIGRNDLVPPSGVAVDWPWRLEVRVLGGLSITPTPAWGRKRPRVPLALLDLLALRGRPSDRRVPRETLIDALWPDAEGDAGRHNLEMGISRLRKILGDSSTIVVDSAGVGLDPARTWVDVWQLERLLAEPPSPERQREIAALYAGPPSLPLPKVLVHALARSLQGASRDVLDRLSAADASFALRLESATAGSPPTQDDERRDQPPHRS